MPLGDPLYDYLDHIADQGLVPAYLRGTRPITVDYAARLVQEAAVAARRRGEAEPAAVTVARDLVERLRAHRWGGVDVGGQATVAGGVRREIAEPVPHSFDERVGYLEPRNGGSLSPGDGAAAAVVGRGACGGFMAADLALSLDFPDGGAALRLRRGSVKVGWAALELQAGRDDLAWGQARHAPLILSGFAPAFDLVLLRTARPVRLPWVLRYLGHWQATLFVARLDQELPYRRPWLVGMRLASKPVSWFEVAFSHLYAFGGDGAPYFGAARAAEEFFGYRREVSSSNYANHGMSMDGHLRVSRWFEAYGEWYLEDCCAHVVGGQDSSFIAGLRRARVLGARDDVALEFAYTTRIAFLSSGVTEWSQGHVITGHPLGAKGLGAYALYTLLGDRGQVLKLRLALERRGSPYDLPGAPPQWRVGGLLDLRWPLLPGRAGRVDARGRLGLERVLSVGRVPGDDRMAGLAEVLVEASF
ncbi:MAG: hypothetical protein HY906_07225 [Deltaproteobacteria bacterium]|nr:hypothetical protein [Deltaproteobacteria bacterium]